MRRIVKKNQIIITALAILIAVAGYLNYSEKNMKQLTKEEKEASETVSDPAALQEFEKDSLLQETGDIESNDYDPEGEQTETDNGNAGEDSSQAADIDEIPGTAVLTNVGTFSANARLQREQLRAKNKETLMEMMNGAGLSEEQKSEITEEMIKITQTAELENEIETLLEAKGFAGAVVSVTEDQVDVVVNMTEVDDSGRAKIEDVVKRKTNVPASHIVITPISIGD